MTQIVDRNFADKIAMLIDEGLPVDDVAQMCNVSKNFVSFIEHDVGLHAYVGISQERLEELADNIFCSLKRIVICATIHQSNWAIG